MINRLLTLSGALGALAFPLLAAAQPVPAAGPADQAKAAQPPARDWTTWGYDEERTGWNRGETVLTPQNVGQLALKWSVTVPVAPKDVTMATLTSPIVVEGVATPKGKRNLLFTQGADGTLFAIDVGDGKILWQKAFPTTIKPQRPANTNCSNTVQATPVVDRARNLIFFHTLDGKLHGLALATGVELLRPTQFVAPYSRSWSLNLIDGVVYTASGRGCGNGNPVETGAVSAMDVTDLDHPQLSRTYTGKERPAGPWGRGGPVKGPGGVFVQTADGPNDPGSGIFGNAVVQVTPKAYGVGDSFVPPNWKYLNSKDLDFGSASPVTFPFGKRTLLAAAAKEGVIYLLDANNLGGRGSGRDVVPDHQKPLYQSPRYGNDLQTYAENGVWGAMTTAVSAKGDRWLYVPMWGPPAAAAPKFPKTYGPSPHGSVMAFKVAANGDGVELQPQWSSSDELVPDAVSVANGVVYAMQTAGQPGQHVGVNLAANPDAHGAAGQQRETEADQEKFRSTPVGTMTLFALDAETGQELYSSKALLDGNFTHFTQPVVALGRVFVVDHNAHVYAFGLK